MQETRRKAGLTQDVLADEPVLNAQSYVCRHTARHGAQSGGIGRLLKFRTPCAVGMNLLSHIGLIYSFISVFSGRMSSISSDNIINTYRFYAPLYDRLFGAVFEPGRRSLTDATSALACASILEVGIGTGLTLARYPATSKVVGIDISSDMLSVARARAERLNNPNIQLAVMNAEEMDFPDDSFDCVTMPYVLSVTPHPERLVSEICRVCKADGTILILNHFSDSRFWWLLEQALHPLANRIGFRPEFYFHEHILKYDWEVESAKKVNFLGLSTLVKIRNNKVPPAPQDA